MFKEPKEQAKLMFNEIRFMDGKNEKCNTCDCVVIPILKYMIMKIIESEPKSWYNNGFEWEKEYLQQPCPHEGWIDSEKYWNAVLLEVDEI